jgi:hypothetical protein
VIWGRRFKAWCCFLSASLREKGACFEFIDMGRLTHILNEIG